MRFQYSLMVCQRTNSLKKNAGIIVPSIRLLATHNNNNNNNNGFSSSKPPLQRRNFNKGYYLLSGIGTLVGYYLYQQYTCYCKEELVGTFDRQLINTVSHKSNSKSSEKHLQTRSDLPTYTMNEVSTHNTIKNRVWVTFGIGVYDVTDFIPEHPGGLNIMLGAGSAVDPFWHIYQQHNTPEILRLLETMRIGNLSQDDQISTSDMGDPWQNEPKRHPALIVRAKRPFNAEPPTEILADTFITPSELFYVRNHLPVPDIDINEYELEIEVGNTSQKKVLKFSDVLKLPRHTITATVMCGGNRRSEMNRVKQVQGLEWSGSVAGNAKWTGVKLCDILKSMGVVSDEHSHVILEGSDLDPTGSPYAASIPLAKAMDPRGDVLLAYEMNGKPLSRDHGYPIRVLVPGVVGARNVKWVSRIIVSAKESDSHWQQKDYKGFSPSTDWDTADFSKSPAIQNMPVTSFICFPKSNDTVQLKDNKIAVKGYAWSGGGNKIIRIDVTSDGGKTWHVGNLVQEENKELPNGRHWSWTLWNIEIPVDKKHLKNNEVEIWSKAVDSNYNVQSETFENIWNIRGVLSNAYSRIKVKVSGKLR